MADMSGEQMQAKITAARREAEGLKDKIKRRKDELAEGGGGDGSRTGGIG
jgi:guanine nucleotide-binding protein G(I)/G(S)/G(T) subunit beta-1